MCEREANRPLIVFYSYSGNTCRIAEALWRLTGGERQEIYPLRPYPAAFPELLEQVQREVREKYCPRLILPSASVDRYDVIFVGSPQLVRHYRSAAVCLAPPAESVGKNRDAFLLSLRRRAGKYAAGCGAALSESRCAGTVKRDQRRRGGARRKSGALAGRKWDKMAGMAYGRAAGSAGRSGI